jgi:hypothetical protein
LTLLVEEWIDWIRAFGSVEINIKYQFIIEISTREATTGASYPKYQLIKKAPNFPEELSLPEDK